MRVGGPTGDKKFCWTKDDVLLDNINDDYNRNLKIYVQGFPQPDTRFFNCPQIMPYHEDYYYNDNDGNGFYVYPCWRENIFYAFGTNELVMDDATRPDRCNAPYSDNDNCGWFYEDRCKFKYKDQDAYFKPSG